MMVPLTFTGLSLCIIYQSKHFSLVADGCFYMGSIVASYVAINFVFPNALHPMIALLLSAIIGGLIGVLPGIIKIKWKANELVSSLMLNYVFYFWGLYIVNYYLRDPDASVLSYLRIGADMMSRRADVDNEIIAIIQTVMILLITAERFLAYWKLQEENKLAKEKYLHAAKEVQ